MTNPPNCPCDVFVHPEPLDIDAALPTVPRQIAAFPQFRHAMLSALPTKPPLADWRARGDQDLGVMAIEMFAYVCDVVSFYDETIAHEVYLRTARLQSSVRKLVALLGYRPRPAVGALARLAIKADGRLPIALPKGLAFRSSAFGAEPPQVFELDADSRVHPLLNGWSLARTRPTSIAAGATSLLLAPDSARARVGDDLVVVSGASIVGVFTALSVESVTGSDGVAYRKVVLDRSLGAAVDIASTRLLRPNATAALWSSASDTSFALAAGSGSLFLASMVPQIKNGSVIVARGPAGASAFTITAVSQTSRQFSAGGKITSTGSTITTTTPEIRVPVTQISIAPTWPASLGTDASKITIEYDLQDAGVVTAELPSRIALTDPLVLLPPIEAPPDGTQPGDFIVDDADGTAAELTGGIDFTARRLNPAVGNDLTPVLDPPSTVYANVVAVSRGETVKTETLGTGDASIAHQAFKLKKKPLTYLSAPTAADPNRVRSALRVWVRDIEWSEVPSLFGIAPDAPVFIVRQDDEQVSSVIFGSPIPTGATVVASYRFGAGAASPPSGSIIQLAKPVKGVTSVKNPIAAAGGDDTQPASQVRTLAPRSALLFGRAVSIKDMEALAACQPGVRAVQALWTWDLEMQLPVVQVWYIGPASIATAVTTALRSATAPSTPIKAGRAQPDPRTLEIEVLVDSRYQKPLVKAAVKTRLMADGIGLLSAERIGIGTPLYSSRILAEVLDVDGVVDVHSLVWNGVAFDPYGKLPSEGTWFQVSLTVNTAEAQNA